MNISLVAERYARALLEISIGENLLEEVYQDSVLISQTCENSRELCLLLNSPIISTEKKRTIIREIFKNNIHQITLTYLLIMVRKKRESFIPLIATKLVELYKNYKNILTVQFKSPVLPDPDIRKYVLDLMAKYSGKDIDLKAEIDESLIGGFVLTWEDKQYDSSIRREIENLRNAIARINLYKKKI
ncbi:MAG: ATP synthase F1 subunit delta [Bacteroidales bacterium]|jgi:F-type H+-transporting ATPase subunit delta|nr:ATP synthase F1 subunit delta [Bacteroidales bacterium]